MPTRKQPVQDVEEDEEATQFVKRRKTSVTASSTSPVRKPKPAAASRRPPTRQQSQQLQQLQQEVDDEEGQFEAHQPREQGSINPRHNPFLGWAKYYSNPHPLTLLRGFRNVTSLVGFLFLVNLFLYGDTTSTGVLYNNAYTSTSAPLPHTAHEIPYTTLTATSFDAMLSLEAKINTSANNTFAAFDVARAAACANLVKIWHPAEMSTHMRCQAICEDVRIGR